MEIVTVIMKDLLVNEDNKNSWSVFSTYTCRLRYRLLKFTQVEYIMEDTTRMNNRKTGQKTEAFIFFFLHLFRRSV